MNDQVVGFIAAAIAVFCLGTTLVVIKKVNTGDGMFFQFVRCTSIWVCGLIAYIVRDSPSFEPLAILGGFFWAMGNVCIVPIVKCIGMSMGVLVWGSSNLIVGWASGQFGILGIKKQTNVSSPLLNYLGLVVCLISLVVSLVVKTAVAETPKEAAKSTELNAKLQLQRTDSDNNKSFVENVSIELSEKPSLADETTHLKNETATNSFVDRFSATQKHVLGMFLALIVGVFFGVNFNPPQYLVDHGGHASLIDYVFPHFCGIFLTSIVLFAGYCVYMKSAPILYPEAILPAMTSGAMWSIAQIAWSIANTRLSFAISFPIICVGPGIVATLWGVILFKEISGRKNLILVTVSILISTAGIVLITLSKVL